MESLTIENIRMSSIIDKIEQLSSEQKAIILKRLEQKKNLELDKNNIPKIERSNDTAIISFAQQRLWFLEQLEGPSPTYNIPLSLRLLGQINKPVLTDCFNEIIKRHETLRTNFINIDGEPRQVIVKEHSINIDNIKVDKNNYKEITEKESHQPFDLTHGPLIRVKLLEMTENEHILLIIVHHIIYDGWSTGVLISELSELYNAFINNKKSPLKDLKIQYTDFAAWQRKKLHSETLEKLVNYWKKQLVGISPLLELPTDYPRPAIQSNKGNVLIFYIEEEVIVQLENYSKNENVTLFMTMLAAFYILLFKYSKQNDIAIGTAIANRNHRDLEDLIGFFVNTLVLRIIIDDKNQFREFLQCVKNITLDAYTHQDLPFEELVKIIQPERSLAHSPLFQVMFELQNTPNAEITLKDLNITPIEYDVHVAKFDLTFTLEKHNKGMRGLIEFNTDLFTMPTIERFVNHYKNILNKILVNSEVPIADISVMSEQEQADILLMRNKNTANFPLHRCVHQLFEDQVLKTPNRIAASCNGDQITYLELNHQANKIANILLQHGVCIDERIAIFLDRNISYLITMLGILKSGAAFVPLDPKAVLLRTKNIIDECKPIFIITSSKYTRDVQQLTKKVIFVEQILSDATKIANTTVNPPVNSLAYVIYTSGSTGKPKGVMIEHRGMVNHLYAKISDLEINEKDVIAQIAAQTFDVSVWQFICALLVGARTAIFTEDNAWQPNLLLNKIKDENVTILESVPSHTKVILDEQESNASLYNISSLRAYISNAEPLTPEQCIRWLKLNPEAMIVNAYGATECSDDTHHLHIITNPNSSLPYVPVRESLANLQTYILDSNMQPVPIGIFGEIYIGGVGVGRGYFNEPQKTALSFVPNPFSGKLGDRLYRTGDVARLNTEGNIEFHGRVDFQVKVNGFRVEIGEIESTLIEHSSLQSAFVISEKYENGDNYLVAYIIPKSYPAPTRKEIQKHCINKLPHYMVPVCIIFLDEYPLNNNGKVDRKQLPKPNPYDFDQQLEHKAPRNTLESKIALLWSSVLNREKIGINENFFKVGGHSLLAAELVVKLRKELNLEIELRKLFEFPTVELLANALTTNQTRISAEKVMAPQFSNLKKFPKKEYYDLAPAQIPEWYAYQLDKTSPVYNISFSDLFYKNLNIDLYIQTWQIILNRHECFRICFDYKNGRPVQKLLPPLKIVFKETILDFRHIQIEEIDSVARKLAYEYSNIAFDFENGPLFVLKIALFPNNEYQLLFVVHHIIWDETSTINLFSEIAQIYNCLSENKTPQLKNIELSYFDYVQWINQSIQEGKFDQHKKYWLDIYQELPPVLDLPTDFPRPAIMTFNGDSYSSWFSRTQVRKLNPFLERNNITLFMFMMAIIDLYFFRITGQKDLVIGSPIAGRDNDLFKPIMGLFATPLPIRCQLHEDMSFIDLLLQVKNRALEAFEHHYYPCNLVIEELDHIKDLSRPKLFSVMYGVQNNKTEVYMSAQLNNSEYYLKDLYGAEANSARFDLTLVVDQWGSDIAFNCIYNTDLFKKTTVMRMMQEMLYLVDEVLNNPELPLIQYNIFSNTNQLQLLKELSYTKLIFPNTTITELFEEQVKLNPMNLALSFADIKISYIELNKAANQFARFLLSQGVQSEQPIGVLLSHSPKMIISLLGILKISAHYVPISVDYPISRINEIIFQAKIEYIVVDELSRNLLENQEKIICIDSNESEITQLDSQNLQSFTDQNTLAYIIFTSGTTGQPKGIPITHGGVINLLASTQNDYQLTTSDSILALTPFTFDASILDLFWPLANGASIVIPEYDIFKNTKAIAKLIQAHKVSVLQCVPVMLEALIETNITLDSLRLVICGGALMTRLIRDRFYTRFHCRLMNHYGPTEVTVDAARFDCANEFTGDIVPIGKPIANSYLFILDPYLNLVPKGVIGEIYISSPGLTHGYLGDLEKTKNAFIIKILNGKPYRLYKSGDLGKLSEDGNVYYIGRTDKQVKVRGNRVELEEIDNALQAHPFVKNALVKYVSQHSSDGQLIAYVDYKDSFNRFIVGNEYYQLFTVAEKPELIRHLNAEHTTAWPSYFAGSNVLKKYWSRIYNEFEEFQFGLLADNEEIAAFGNSVPIYWDGNQESLPSGWDEALIQSFESNRSPNTLFILSGIVAPVFQRKGISSVILKAFKMIAKGHHLERIIVAVRPTGKTHHPEIDFASWCYTRRDDGQLADHWLRTHEKVGGKVLKLCLESQLIEGSIEQWEKWTAQKINMSGHQLLNNTLQPSHVNLEKNEVRYFDPAIWVEHYWNSDDNYNWEPLNKNKLRKFLSTILPSYMIPEYYYFLNKLPLLESGKINEKILPTPTLTSRNSLILPKTALQKDLTKIWCQILKLQTIGITDDFFELGGQSLKVVQMLEEVAEYYGFKIQLCHFYKYPTIKNLEELLIGLKSGTTQMVACSINDKVNK